MSAAKFMVVRDVNHELRTNRKNIFSVLGGLKRSFTFATPKKIGKIVFEPKGFCPWAIKL